MNKVLNPFFFNVDLVGKPLTNGFIYVGIPGQNPETHPVQLYRDRAGTQPLAQPIRTTNGYPTLNGNIIAIYGPARYSLTVKDSTRRLLYYTADNINESVDFLEYGADESGATDSLAALNAAISDLNNGVIKSLHINPGTYIIDGDPNSILRGGIDIYGHGYSSLMTKTSGTGTLFKFGNGSTLVGQVSVSGLYLDCDHSNGILNGPMFDFIQARDFIITEIKAGNAAGAADKGLSGFVKFGDNSLGTRCQKIRISNCQVQAHGSANGTIFDVQNATTCDMATIVVNVNDQSSGDGPLSIHIHPENTETPLANLVDSITWTGVKMNFPNFNVAHVMDIDGTSGSIVNQWFTDCVFDQTQDVGINIHVDSGAISGVTNRINNIFFTSSRVYTQSGECLIIDNSGSKSMYKIKFINCTFASVDSSIFKVSNGNGLVQLKAIGCDFVDSVGSTARPVIEVDNLDSLILIGNEVDANNSSLTCAFDDFVKITGDTRSVINIGNELTRITGQGFTRTAEVVNKADYRIVDNNAGDASFVQKKTTTGATPNLILAFDIDEGGVYYAEVLVTGRQSDGSNRAVYKMGAYFYRNVGGNATQQGSTQQLITAIETDAAWDATFSNSTTMGEVTVTGKAATTINWGAELYLRRLI